MIYNLKFLIQISQSKNNNDLYTFFIELIYNVLYYVLNSSNSYQKTYYLLGGDEKIWGQKHIEICLQLSIYQEKF